MLPGVVYGIDDDKNVLKVMVSVDKTSVQNELRTNGKSFENTIYELSVKGEDTADPLKFVVVPRDTQFCARKFTYYCFESNQILFLIISLLQT